MMPDSNVVDIQVEQRKVQHAHKRTFTLTHTIYLFELQKYTDSLMAFWLSGLKAGRD